MSARVGPWLRALASLSAKTAIRSRLVPSVGVLLLVVLVVLAWKTTGDGSPRGRMQAFLNRGTGFIGFVLALTTVFLATRFATHLQQGRLVGVCAAPVSREGLLLAWWLGTVGTLLALTGLAFVTLGVCAHAMVWLAPAANQEAMQTVLDARGLARSIPPDEEVLRERVEQRYAELERSERLPEGIRREDAIERLLTAQRLRLRSVPFQKRKLWTVAGIDPSPGATHVLLRFRSQAEGSGPAGFASQPKVRGKFTFYAPGSLVGGSVQGRFVTGQFHELPIPVEWLSGSDRIQVEYVNEQREQQVVVVFPAQGISVLYPATSFPVNLVRAALIQLGRLAFLAALGVVLASLLDGKLAALVALFVLLLGTGHGFLLESLRPGLFGALDGPLQAVLRTVLWVVPDLVRVDLSVLLASGLQVEPGAVAEAIGLDGLARGGIVLAIGARLFAGRELGAIR